MTKEANDSQSAAKALPAPEIPTWVIIGLFGLFVVVTLVAIFWGGTLSPIAQQFMWIAASAFIAAAFYSTTTRAELRDFLPTGKSAATGSLGILCISYMLFYCFAPKGDTQNVRISLMHQGAPLVLDFSLVADFDNMELQKKQGHDGQASIEVPSHITRIASLKVNCPGYKEKHVGPYDIVNKRVILDMIKTAPPPPLSPGDLPSSDIFPVIPNKEKVDAPPAEQPSNVTLFYRNLTDEDVTLLLYSLSRHYKIQAANSGGSAWMSFPLAVGEKPLPFNNFTAETGLFGFVIRDQAGRSHYLTIADLYTRRLNYFTLKAFNDGRYTFEINGVEQ